MIFKVLSIDASADSQECPHCGSSNVMEQVSKVGMKCNACLEVFEENEGISWTWNNWFNTGEYSEEEHGPLNEENALKFFYDEIISEGKGIEAFKSRFEIVDDQYNLVIVFKENQMPIYAIEYGSEV